jgi:hypothetical protein
MRNNLAAQDPKIAADLQKQLRVWRKDVKAQMPVINPDYVE